MQLGVNSAWILHNLSHLQFRPRFVRGEFVAVNIEITEVIHPREGALQQVLISIYFLLNPYGIEKEWVTVRKVTLGTHFADEYQ